MKLSTNANMNNDVHSKHGGGKHNHGCALFGTCMYAIDRPTFLWRAEVQQPPALAFFALGRGGLEYINFLFLDGPLAASLRVLTEAVFGT